MPDNAYNAWADSNKNFCFVSKKISYRPLISIIVPVFNPRYNHLLEMVYSVINQHYDNWELLLVSASTNTKSRRQTEACIDIDVRIKIINVSGNKGISANTNAGLKEAAGEYVSFLDHDDLLHPCALHSVVETLQSSKPVDLVYTDEDKINDSSERFFSPHCKPDWSPDLLRNVNYMNHLTVARTQMVRHVEGLRPICDGAQDYDLLLRVIDECAPAIKHIPRILYHWRAAESSTAKDIQTKDYVFRAGTRALSDHIKRNKIPATVRHISGKPGFYEFIYEPVDFSIIIGQVAASKEQACVQWLKKLFRESSRGSRVATELIIGQWYKKHENWHPEVKVRYTQDKADDYWQEAVDMATHPVTVCFKMAAMPKGRHGLAQLAAVASDTRYTAVAPVVVSDNDTILDAGVVGSRELPKKLFEGYKLGRNTYFGNTDWVRNVNDLTTNIVAINTERLRHLIASGIRTYHQSDTLNGLSPTATVDDSYFVVWAHTPFKYKGLLKPRVGRSYHNSQLFQFTPTVTMHVDNWGESYGREQED
ncbi:MAG TPA: glycosyltransferase [Candidatus Saccharimonadales bacterium]|nr:glycosyltransferase [Candidatus Saccharimonadales bacterium]